MRIAQNICLSIISVLCTFSLWAQEQDSVKEDGVTERIFNSYFEIGYLSERSAQLGGGLILKSAFEYRMKGTPHPFIRLNYDQYDPVYNLNLSDGPSKILNESASMSDLLLGPGYRFGKYNLRITFVFQAGIRDYPSPNRVSGTTPEIIYMEGGNWIPSSRFTTGLEYYLDDFFAITLELFQHHVWKATGYWAKRKTAIGFSIGLVGTFF